MDLLAEMGGKYYTQEEKIAYADQKDEYYRELLGQMSLADLSEKVKSILDTGKSVSDRFVRTLPETLFIW